MEKQNLSLLEKGINLQLSNPNLNFFHIMLSDLDNYVTKADIQQVYFKLKCGPWVGRTSKKNVDQTTLDWLYDGSELKIELSSRDLDHGTIIVELFNANDYYGVSISSAIIELQNLEWQFDKVAITSMGLGLNDNLFEDTLTITTQFKKNNFTPNKYILDDTVPIIATLRLTLELRALVTKYGSKSISKLRNEHLLGENSNMVALRPDRPIECICSVKNPTFQATRKFMITSDGTVSGSTTIRVKPIANQPAIYIGRIVVEDSNRVVFRKKVSIVIQVEACGGEKSCIYMLGYKPEVNDYSDILTKINISDFEPLHQDVTYSRKFLLLVFTVYGMYDGCGIKLAMTCPPGVDCCIRQIKIQLQVDNLTDVPVANTTTTNNNKSISPPPRTMASQTESILEIRKKNLLKSPMTCQAMITRRLSSLHGTTSACDWEETQIDLLERFHLRNLPSIEKTFGTKCVDEYIRRVITRMCHPCRIKAQETYSLFNFCLRADCGLRDVYNYRHPSYLQILVQGFQKLSDMTTIEMDSKTFDMERWRQRKLLTDRKEKALAATANVTMTATVAATVKSDPVNQLVCPVCGSAKSLEDLMAAAERCTSCVTRYVPKVIFKEKKWKQRIILQQEAKDNTINEIRKIVEEELKAKELGGGILPSTSSQRFALIKQDSEDSGDGTVNEGGGDNSPTGNNKKKKQRGKLCVASRVSPMRKFVNLNLERLLEASMQEAKDASASRHVIRRTLSSGSFSGSIRDAERDGGGGGKCSISRNSSLSRQNSFGVNTNDNTGNTALATTATANYDKVVYYHDVHNDNSHTTRRRSAEVKLDGAIKELIEVVTDTKAPEAATMVERTSKVPLLHPSVSYTVKQWTVSQSSSQLVYLRDDHDILAIANRPSGSVDSHNNNSIIPTPAVCTLQSPLSSFTIIIENYPTLANHTFSFGIARNTSPTDTSIFKMNKGFGLSHGSWGVYNSRSSSSSTNSNSNSGNSTGLATEGITVLPFQRLKKGDILQLKIDLDDCSAFFSVLTPSHSNTPLTNTTTTTASFSYKFLLPHGQPKDFLVGVTLAEHCTVRILPMIVEFYDFDRLHKKSSKATRLDTDLKSSKLLYGGSGSSVNGKYINSSNNTSKRRNHKITPKSNIIEIFNQPSQDNDTAGDFTIATEEEDDDESEYQLGEEVELDRKLSTVVTNRRRTVPNIPNYSRGTNQPEIKKSMSALPLAVDIEDSEPLSGLHSLSIDSPPISPLSYPTTGVVALRSSLQTSSSSTDHSFHLPTGLNFSSSMHSLPSILSSIDDSKNTPLPSQQKASSAYSPTPQTKRRVSIETSFNVSYYPEASPSSSPLPIHTSISSTQETNRPIDRSILLRSGGISDELFWIRGKAGIIPPEALRIGTYPSYYGAEFIPFYCARTILPLNLVEDIGCSPDVEETVSYGSCIAGAHVSAVTLYEGNIYRTHEECEYLVESPTLKYRWIAPYSTSTSRSRLVPTESLAAGLDVYKRIIYIVRVLCDDIICIGFYFDAHTFGSRITTSSGYFISDDEAMPFSLDDPEKCDELLIEFLCRII